MNRWLHKFMEKPDISDNTDISDRFDSNVHLSVLSVHPQGLLDKKMKNMPGGGPDKSDRLDPNLNMSVLSGRTPGLLGENFSPYDAYDLDERLAIAEYDGVQTPLHAHRIAYLDAFISVLTSLPATTSQRDWLDQRIQTSLAWIEAQGFHSIN